MQILCLFPKPDQQNAELGVGNPSWTDQVPMPSPDSLRSERVSTEKTIKALERIAQKADGSPALVNKYLTGMV